jgi:hypothetical protein
MILGVKNFVQRALDRVNVVEIDWTNVRFQLLVNFINLFYLIKLNFGILGTLCYCDEFCDQHINPDCCPDYEPVCKGIFTPEPITECEINGQKVPPGEKVKVDSCNSW